MTPPTVENPATQELKEKAVNNGVFATQRNIDTLKETGIFDKRNNSTTTAPTTSRDNHLAQHTYP